ncbi:salicylaldehyde dehydrogenase [Thozetella sp. PMI_491]|nr:salicylaldehyde dehydrogenase [Thozetella sp. PMI_491]
MSSNTEIDGKGAESREAGFGIVIDGQDITTPETFSVLDPVTRNIVHWAPSATESDAIRAVETADAAFETWREATPLERRNIMLKAVEILQGRKDELVKAMVAETGAKPSWAAFNIKTGIEFVQEAAGMATQIKGELLQSNDRGTLAMVFREPCGVILGIAPWNAPIILGIRAFITPLVCGNTVVLKASESSPYTQYLLVDSFRKAGLPPGVLNFVCCPRNLAPVVTESMIAHPAVQRVNFTGSTAVGRIIAHMSAKYLKPAMLELGGKAPMIVLKDANVEEAVRAAAFGAMQHQGQICMSTERVIIHKSLFGKFAELFGQKVSSLHAADPRVDGSAALGSLITPDAGARVNKLIGDALAQGATVCGGTHAVEGAIVQPIALKGVQKGMDIYYQESFGPVVSLFEFETIEEAIRLANDTEYGLVSSVYSDNITEALAVARRIRSGSCHINGPTVHDEPHLPLGGQKASGYGRFGGTACIKEFTEERVVTIGSHGHHYPI